MKKVAINGFGRIGRLVFRAIIKYHPELETFPGILILTTNLESNHDEAFFRRFNLKFKLPDLESRINLWRMYLRKEIPGSEDIDVEALARRYQFSGAQISMVV